MESVLKNNLLGLCVIAIDRLEPHPCQRAIDENFIRDLERSLTVLNPRISNPLSVIPQGDLSEDVVAALQSSQAPDLPPDMKFWVVDGQHRVRALEKLKEKGYMSENPEFYKWPCQIFKPEFAQNDILRAYMVSMNDIGDRNLATFAENVLALSAISDPTKRLEMCHQMPKTAKDAGLLSYVVTSPFWDEMKEICKRPLYQSLTKKDVFIIRKRHHCGEFYSLILRDLVKQHDDVLELLKDLEPKFQGSLTIKDFSSASGEIKTIKLKTGSSGHSVGQPNLLFRLRHVPGVTGGCAPLEKVMKELERRKSSNGESDPGPPYVFGCMILSPAEFGESGEVTSMIDKCDTIMKHIRELLPVNTLDTLRSRPATKGETKDVYHTWGNNLLKSLSPASNKSGIEEVLTYVLQNCDSLFLGSIQETPLPYDGMKKVLKNRNEAREAWNQLVAFCVDRGFPFDYQGRTLFFPDIANQNTGAALAPEAAADEREALEEEPALEKPRKRKNKRQVMDDEDWGDDNPTASEKGKKAHPSSTKSSSNPKRPVWSAKRSDSDNRVSSTSAKPSKRRRLNSPIQPPTTGSKESLPVNPDLDDEETFESLLGNVVEVMHTLHSQDRALAEAILGKWTEILGSMYKDRQ